MSDPGAEPRLVVPEGLVIDESVRERLERRARARRPTRRRIAAEIARARAGRELPRARRVAALETRGRRTRRGVRRRVADPRRGAGAAARRVRVDDGRVEVAGGLGARRPGRAGARSRRGRSARSQAASERGRPPFPRRPVVVFLGCEPFRDADWVRRLVNRLVRHDVEARIATPEPPAAGDGPCT